MRKNGNLYEYIGSYVDDLAIAAQDPKRISDELQNRYNFKLKGTGPITFHQDNNPWNMFLQIAFYNCEMDQLAKERWRQDEESPSNTLQISGIP
jgi:hypothetical protein